MIRGELIRLPVNSRTKNYPERAGKDTLLPVTITCIRVFKLEVFCTRITRVRSFPMRSWLNLSKPRFAGSPCEHGLLRLGLEGFACHVLRDAAAKRPQRKTPAGKPGFFVPGTALVRQGRKLAAGLSAGSSPASGCGVRSYTRSLTRAQ